MDQSRTWKANSHSASKEMPRLLKNLKVHYRVHNSPLAVHKLSQMSPVHPFPHYFPKINSSIIIPSTSMSSEWSLPFRFSDQNFVCISHVIPLNLITLIIFDEASKLWSSSLCILLQPPATSSFLVPSIPVSTLLSEKNKKTHKIHIRIVRIGCLPPNEIQKGSRCANPVGNVDVRL